MIDLFKKNYQEHGRVVGKLGDKKLLCKKRDFVHL
jgi:hypothetical protein